MIKKLLPLGLALAAALTLPQPAAAGTPAPDERAAAREFAYAAYRLRVAVKAQAPEIRRQLLALDGDACLAGLADASKPDRRVPGDVATVFGEAALGAMVGPVTGPLRTMLAELERVPTQDRALRSGRAAWRATVTVLAGVRPLPADFCARLGDWVRAGFPAASAPHLQSPAVQALFEDDESTERWEIKQRRAADRMEALGVPAGQAGRFRVENLFEGLDPEPLDA